MDLKSYVGAVVADITEESWSPETASHGLAITFEDGRTLRVWATHGDPEDFSIAEGAESGATR